MQDDVRSRKATDSDISFAWPIYSEAVRPLMEALIFKERGEPWDDTEEERRFRDIWSSEKTQILELDGTPIGWLSLDKGADTFVLENLIIKHDFRGRGLGTAVLHWLKSEAGDQTLHAFIVPGSRAQSFYERAGFIPEGVGLHQTLLVSKSA